MAKTHKPGDLFRAHQSGDKKSVNRMMKALKSSSPIKHSGSFQGKSNALGHGGRAAQMKARGVPGGVIGAIARREGAAPGGPNFHGKAKKKAHKAPTPAKMDMEMAMKKKRKASGNDHDADDKKRKATYKNVSEGKKYTEHGHLTSARGLTEKKRSKKVHRA